MRQLGEFTIAQLSAGASPFQQILVHTGMESSEKRFLQPFFSGNWNFHFAYFVKSRASVPNVRSNIVSKN